MFRERIIIEGLESCRLLAGRHMGEGLGRRRRALGSGVWSLGRYPGTLVGAGREGKKDRRNTLTLLAGQLAKQWTTHNI